MTRVRVDEFNYELPDELIAQVPLEHRADSRLMVVDPVEQIIRHQMFRDLPDLLEPGDVLVMNDSRVIPARIFGIKEDTGARIELLLVRPAAGNFNGDDWLALARPAKRLKAGNRILLSPHAGSTDSLPADAPEAALAEVIEVLPDGLRRIRFQHEGSLAHLLDEVGSMPLPPYIHVPLRDRDRYQTVYANTPGSVAAPTAGLHFTPGLLEALKARQVELQKVTLHVGLGTFRPVQVDDIEDHVMHSETYEVSEATADAINRAKREGRRIIAVGTTALRTLESAGRDGVIKAGTGETDIFIYPGFSFRIIDGLITNFHLPKSTLLMLVAALMGTGFTRTVYETAVQERYRFFSFGDAMLISRRSGE